MIIESLGRHFAVASVDEARLMVDRDRGFWNVISIHESCCGPAKLPGAKAVHRLIFDDAENPSEDGSWVLARETDIRGAFEFADARAGEPLLIHCHAGVSRSAAVALALIVRALYPSKDRVEEAVQQLLVIRRRARPNVHVLNLGLRQFLPVAEARKLVKALVNHPVLLHNRFVLRG